MFIGEVLLNHLILLIAFDCIVQVYVAAKYTRCVSGLCRIELFSIVFNFNKTVYMTLKAESAKSSVTPLLTVGGENVKYVNQYKYYLDTELSDDKDIQSQLRYQYCAANKLRFSFSRCSNAVKNVFFRSFCTPMYASQSWCYFRKCCMQRLRVAYNFGCKALYILPGERVLVVVRFNITFLHLRPY